MALAAACEAIAASDRNALEAEESGLVRRLRIGIVSFAGVPASKVSEFLARARHRRTRRVLSSASARLGVRLADSAVRASVGIGSAVEHVDCLLLGLRQLISNDAASVRARLEHASV